MRVLIGVVVIALIPAGPMSAMGQFDYPATTYGDNITPHKGAPSFDTARQEFESTRQPHTGHAMAGVSVGGGSVNGQAVSVQVGHQTEPAGTSNPLPLPPRREGAGSSEMPKPQTPARAVTTVIAALAIVLGLFFLVVWFTRRALPKAATSLPNEVVEVLGRTPLGNRQMMQVVRFGNKLLLLSVTTAGAETLSEISDAAEIDRITALCQQSRPDSISSTFRHVLAQFNNEPATVERANSA